MWRRSETRAIASVDELDVLATRLARASRSDIPHGGWTVVFSTSQQVVLYVSNRAGMHRRAQESRRMYTVTTSVRSGIMAMDLRAPVDITLPYGAHGASHAATAAAASRRDVRVVSERAQGRSIDPARGSGRKGAASGARRGRLEWIGTSYYGITVLRPGRG